MSKKVMTEKELANLIPIKKGEVRNPNGKKKGTKDLKTVYREALIAISNDKEWSSPLVNEKILIITAKDKDGKYLNPPHVRLQALADIENRLDGKPVETQNVNIAENSIQLIDPEEKNI